jgi:AcrR family transcriptional regulator
MENLATLADRRNELTRTLILEAAIELLEHGSVAELTARAAAKQANISERTMFRYFPSREDFLDAVADEMRTRLDLPPPPESLDELCSAPGPLYHAFEAKPNLTKAALHPDIFSRMRESQAKVRWLAVRKIIDTVAPHQSERERKFAAANIRYYLSASTWHYYRFYFGFSIEESITCAEKAILQSIDGVRKAR